MLFHSCLLPKKIFSSLTVGGVYYGIATLQRPQKQLNFRQLRFIHSLSDSDIWQVDVELEQADSVSVTKFGQVESFKKFLADAKVCGPVDVDNSEKVRIEIRTSDGGFRYEAFVPVGNQDDILLRLSAGPENSWIRLPGLKRWLDENILNKEDLSQ